jgi:hypothetical protein
MRIVPDDLINLLRVQTGPRNGLRVTDLAELLLPGEGKNQAVWRNIRSVIKGLRMQGYPICGHPSRGYYWASTPEDLSVTIAFLRDRAFSSLKQISRLKKVALPVLEGQLQLPIGGALIEPEQPDYSQSYRESVVIEISDQLLGEVMQFCETNPDWSRNKVIQEALTMFLNGVD